jgi:CubicO group peptidase (beta-lactamase class C family)
MTIRKRAVGYAAAGIIIVAVALTVGSRVTASTKTAGVPPPLYWPTKEWRESSPEQQGVDSEKLKEALDTIHKKQLPIHSLLVIRNGYVILDATFFPYDGTTPHDVASCTKSVSATLVGAAIQDGKIKSVHDRVLDYFSGRTILNSDERKRRVAISDLLTMRSGLQCDYKGGEPTLREMRASPDWTQFMLDRPMADDPGTTFAYCSEPMRLAV